MKLTKSLDKKHAVIYILLRTGHVPLKGIHIGLRTATPSYIFNAEMRRPKLSTISCLNATDVTGKGERQLLCSKLVRKLYPFVAY